MSNRILVFVACLVFGAWVDAMNVIGTDTDNVGCAVADDTSSAKYAAVVEFDGKRFGTLLSEEPDVIENLTFQFSENEVVELKVRHFGAEASVDAYLFDQNQTSENDGKIVYERQPAGNHLIGSGAATTFEIASELSKKHASISFEILDVATFEQMVAEGKILQTGCCRCGNVKCCPMTGKCMGCSDCGECCKGTD